MMAKQSLFRDRRFRSLCLLTFFVSLGDWAATVALTLQIYNEYGTGWSISAIYIAELLPWVLAGSAIGRWVDRHETVALIAVTSAAQVVLIGGLAWGWPLPLTLTVWLFVGGCLAISKAGSQALVPSLVAEDQFSAANSYLAFARWGGSASGPVMAGAVASIFNPQGALLASALVMGGATVTALYLRSVHRRQPEALTEGEDDSGGWMVLRRDRGLGIMTFTLAGVVVFASIEGVALVFFSSEVLAAGEAGYGALLTAWTVGMVAGTLFLSRWIPAKRALPVALGAGILSGGAVLFTAVRPALSLALFLFVLGGIANGVEGVCARTTIHQRAAEAVQGRAFAAYFGVISVAELAALAIGGLIVEVMGPRLAIGIAGGGASVVAAIGLGTYAIARGGARERGSTKP